MTPECRHEAPYCCRHCCAICQQQHELGAVRDAPLSITDLGLPGRVKVTP